MADWNFEVYIPHIHTGDVMPTPHNIHCGHDILMLRVGCVATSL